MKNIIRVALNWIRWLEQYTKTDMVYLAKGGFWSILSQSVASLLTFGLAISFAHFVSKEVYGQYKYVLSIASIMGAFTLTGLNTAVLQSTTRGFDGTLNYAFWQNIKWSILFFLISLGASVYYFVNGNKFLGISMLFVGSFFPILKSTNLYNAYLVAKKDFKRSAIYFSIIGNVFPTTCLFLGLLITKNPLWLVIIYLVSNTLIGIILYVRTLSVYKPNNKIDSGALSYSKHLSFIDILATIADNIDQILIFHYIGAAQLAIYNFATAIPSQIKGPLKGLAGLIFPKFAERTDKEIRGGMKNKMILLFFGAILLIGSYVLLAPYIFHIFFPKYTDSIFYSQIFSISLLWIISIPADAYLMVKKKIKEQYIGNILSSLIQILLLTFGIIWWGLLGLIVAQVTTKLVWSIVSIILYEKSSKQSI
jgi:O-antigen/teichoic acid export membrane protein